MRIEFTKPRTSGASSDDRTPNRRPGRSFARWTAVALVLVAACNGGAGQETTTTGGAADGIEVGAWFNGETVPADEFGSLEAESGVIVNWDIRGDAVVNDMLRMRDAGERLPDLIEIDSHLTPAFIEAGLLQPMTEQIAAWAEEDPELYATVPESVWTDGTYDGEIYHMPNKSLVDALFYNVTLLEEAGAPMPPYDSYSELLDAARAVQASNPDLPAYFATGGASHDRMFRWLFAFGVPFDGNVPDLTSSQGVEMIDFLQTMFEEGITDPEFMINQQDEGKGAFVRGELPFIEEGLNGGGGFMLDDFQYGEDWLTAPYPIHEENGGQYTGVPRGWSMTVDSENPYEASLVLRYLSEPEIAAERYFDLESGVVQSIPVLEGEQMREVQPFFTEELLGIFRSLEAQIPPATNTNSVGEVLIDLVEELTVTGTDEAPEEVAARYQAMLDEV
jgi:multiple sugar transport system substrate-binding protein